MFDGRWRHGVERLTKPVGRQLVRWHITADVVTASGLVFSVGTAIVVTTGHLLIGIPLLALTGFHDLFDGPVAKASGTASVRGALFDSVADRVSDAVLMGGVSWYLIASHHHQMAVLPLAVLGAASLVSYVRAKAEALGLPTTNGGIFGGLMERAERMILLGAGFLEPWLLVPVLWVLFGLTMVTAVARFAGAWRSAEGPVRPERPARPVRPLRPARGEGPRAARRRRDARDHRPWRTRRVGTAGGAGAAAVGAVGAAMTGTPSPSGSTDLTARWRGRRHDESQARSPRSWARRPPGPGWGRHLLPGGAGDGGPGGRGR